MGITWFPGDTERGGGGERKGGESQSPTEYKGSNIEN